MVVERCRKMMDTVGQMGDAVTEAQYDAVLQALNAPLLLTVAGL